MNPYGQTICALRLQPDVSEFADVAAVLEHVGDTHQQKRGVCAECGEVWRCAAIQHADGLALQFAIRGSNVAWERIQARLASHDARKRGAA